MSVEEKSQETTKACPFCGEEIKIGAVFCIHCKHSVAADDLVESLLWEGRSSKWILFYWWLFSLVITLLTFGTAFIILILPILKYYIEIKHKHYKITNQRIRYTHGWFNPDTDDLELYRITDHKMKQSFFFSFFGIVDLILLSSDGSHPVLKIKGIDKSTAKKLKEELRTHVERLKSKRNVRELNVHNV
jgi:uncharacterized membrane protein YdbT with pleckstrin-like domain